MSIEVPIRCRCGALQGTAEVSRELGNRVVCHCDDCQAFAHFLKPEEAVLDEHGGTDIYQMSPSRLRIQQGAESLGCLRLTPKGLLRWYASCCNTPIANCMASPGMPFVGVVHSCMRHGEGGPTRDEALGPVREHVNARFAVGGRPQGPHVHDRFSVAGFLRVIGMLLRSRLRGEQSPSPFFDARTKRPVVEPRVLDAEERAGL
jgi:hypothetical protein